MHCEGLLTKKLIIANALTMKNTNKENNKNIFILKVQKLTNNNKNNNNNNKQKQNEPNNKTKKNLFYCTQHFLFPIEEFNITRYLILLGVWEG